MLSKLILENKFMIFIIVFFKGYSLKLLEML